jgi:hypothetical protein
VYVEGRCVGIPPQFPLLHLKLNDVSYQRFQACGFLVSGYFRRVDFCKDF